MKIYHILTKWSRIILELLTIRYKTLIVLKICLSVFDLIRFRTSMMLDLLSPLKIIWDLSILKYYLMTILLWLLKNLNKLYFKLVKKIDRLELTSLAIFLWLKRLWLMQSCINMLLIGIVRVRYH